MGAEETQRRINRYIQDAINQAESLIKALPNLSSSSQEKSSEGLKVIANLVITKPDGQKASIKLECDTYDFHVDRVVVNGQEFRRVNC
ncbi:hypothetical protein M3Y97_01031400 [Aphelenchoides bicaudatus]|nr:hypothetical protein M3Y97_01031400 [Aphelenchoides bicaudatus]